MTSLATAGRPPEQTRRCWTLVGRDGALDVELTARDGDLLAAVRPELSSLGLSVEALWSGNRRLPDETPLSAPELRHGAVLGLDRPVPAEGRFSGSSALELHVVGGPEAGRTLPLAQGRLVVGRGGEATVRLDDPDVSRRHVSISVAPSGITVADLGSTNGTVLASEELTRRPRSWAVGEVLRMGASALRVSGPEAAPAVVEQIDGGRLRLRPSPTAPPSGTEIEVVFPPEPPGAPRRPLAWVAVLLPALGGGLMAVVLHTPTFLFFALLSPVVAFGNWISDRWSGRRTARKDRAAYVAAVAAAEERLGEAVRRSVRSADAALPDLATVTTAARRRSRLLWSRTAAGEDALLVRIGVGPGSTTVTRVHGDGTRRPEAASHLPIALDLRLSGGLAVIGPRERSVGALSGLVAQLTALHPPGELDLVLLIAADRLGDWAWARWLPHVGSAGVHVLPVSGADRRTDATDGMAAWLTATVRRRMTGRGTRDAADTRRGWLVVLADGPLDARIATMLREAAGAGVLTLTTAETPQALPVVVDTSVRLSGETGDVGVLSRRGDPDRGGILVDRLPRATAAVFARDLAALAPAIHAGALPPTVRLLDLLSAAGPGPGFGPDGGGPPLAQWTRERDRLVATLGRTADGSLEVDLCRQGPHALIAGTTGSGKSELLQTLIAGLALRHPPDRCSFLLVDYKGGAAFAEAAALPHTVGLVTDLDGQTTVRALRSLTAELARREAILSAQGVADIAALPESIALARLVIVVDEFATLADELPDFVPGLVSIAQRGRSLGVHLVLATQRPAGVVSPEIRANCTLRICLRTTDEADSRDILGTADAAFLPVELPGRAFLRSGSGAPTALQVARVSTTDPGSGATAPAVRRWLWPLPEPISALSPREGDSDLAVITRTLLAQAAEQRTPAPHRPWRPSLPDVLPVPVAQGSTDLDDGDDDLGPTSIRIGLVDLPDRQSRRPLDIDLAEGGAWLVVGGPRSGRTTVLRTVLGEAVHRLGPDQLHVHVLESAGGALAADAGALPHTGTAISGDDGLRTARLIDRLAEEVAERRSRASGSERAPFLLLLVDGFEALGAVLDEVDPGRGSGHLHRLIREGAAAGVTCVLTADRAIPGGRLAAVATERLVLPLSDRADYAVAGIPARAVPSHRPPGRALLGENARECQIALPRPLCPADPAAAAGAPAPLRIVELPPEPLLPLPAPPPSGERFRQGAPLLPVGPGGDEGDPLLTDVFRTGGLLVVGPPGCGRSTALDSFVQHFTAAGVDVLRIGRNGLSRSEPIPGDRRDPADEAGVAEWLAERAGRPSVLIADDLGAASDAPALTRLPPPGDTGPVAVLAAGNSGQLSGYYQGPIATLRRSRSGLLLCPGPGDAEFLGIRLPRVRLPVRPGCGWLVNGVSVQRVQVARRIGADAKQP